MNLTKTELDYMRIDQLQAKKLKNQQTFLKFLKFFITQKQCQ